MAEFIVSATYPHSGQVFFVQDRQKLLANGKKSDYGRTDKSEKALRMCKPSATGAARYFKECGYKDVRIIDVTPPTP